MKGAIPPATVLACAVDPQSWDLDEGSYRAGLDARAECFRCSRLADCREELSEMVDAGTPPRSMMWAGVAFSHRGRPIASDEALRSYYRRVDGHRGSRRGTAA
ncbi:hypothetical protein [Rhodococcus sp. IEGM 1379]|uniref:hypothetical protein n=1 Tax=Rhodococcus sp. IEGM 1379 TaxID=3047086 RepID=UPI0024B6DBA2|nr:hypothetical protein [Rhodococcus sp. IEGM 1379]